MINKIKDYIEDKIYYFGGKYRDIMYVFKRIKCFFIRGKKGWSPIDTWALDKYLLIIMSESIEHLAHHSSGCPTEYFDHSIDDNQCYKWKEKLLFVSKSLKEYEELIDKNQLIIKEIDEYYDTINWKDCSHPCKNDELQIVFEKEQERRVNNYKESMDFIRDNMGTLWD